MSAFWFGMAWAMFLLAGFYRWHGDGDLPRATYVMASACFFLLMGIWEKPIKSTP